MSEYQILVFLHLISATIWVGGHLIISLVYLPKALRKNDFSIIENFEQHFETIGMTALVIQVLTGLRLAYILVPDFSMWFNLEQNASRHITYKLILLLATVLLALHARFRLIPQRKLKVLATHIIAVTIIGVLFVFVGYSFRAGGLI